MAKNLWTKEEDVILEDCYKKQIPVKEMVGMLKGRTDKAILKRALRLGFAEKYIRPNSVKFKAVYQDYDWCYERFINRGMTYEEMAKEADTKPRTIQKWCSEKHRLNAYTFKKEKKLTPIQKMIVVSGTLGDGHINKAETQPIYIEVHAEDQKEYLFWKYEILKDINNKPPVEVNTSDRVFSGITYKCKKSYRLSTRIVDELGAIRSMSKIEKIDYLDELGICTLFLDDGSRSNLWDLCFASFNKEEKEHFINVIFEKFKLRGKINKDDRYMLLDAVSSKRLDEIILRNIPNDLDIIKKKITENNKIKDLSNYFFIITDGGRVGVSTYCKNNKINYDKARNVCDNLDLDFPELEENEFLRLMKGVA